MRRKGRLWRVLFKKAFIPLLFFIILFVFYIIYHTKISFSLSASLKYVLKNIFFTIIILTFTFFVQRVISAIFIYYRENIADTTATSLDEELLPLLRRTTKIMLWVIAFLVILPLYGINISALITTLGVSSLAIALAAQDTIANIIAGFMIMIDRPFRIGDKIKLPWGEEVEVLDIGIRRSKFLAEDKAIVIVPNLELSKSKIVNYTYGEERKNNK